MMTLEINADTNMSPKPAAIFPSWKYRQFILNQVIFKRPNVREPDASDEEY
jgi:hypothetical protein